MDLLNLIRKWPRPRRSRHAIMHQSHCPEYACRGSNHGRLASNLVTLFLHSRWSRHLTRCGFRSIPLAALFILAMISCHESHNPTGPLPPLTVADFPTRVGTHWVYHVVDTISGKEDTVDVSITSERIDSTGARVSTWQYSFRNGAFRSDSAMVKVLGDTIWSFDFCCSGLPTQQTIYPVAPGASWKYFSALGVDSSSVIGKETIITPLRSFRSYAVETRTVTPFAMDNFNTFTVWLSKDYGQVRFTHTSGRFPGPWLSRAEIWQLLAYESQVAHRGKLTVP